jgi:hypothetical protein
LEPGQIAEFTILFWNSEKLPITVNLSIKTKPVGWLVIVEPKDFILRKEIMSSEVISLPTGYVNALPVKIYAIPPEKTEAGVHEVVLRMVAGKEEKGVSFFQEKNFNFKINFTKTKKEEFPGEMIQKPVNKTENFTTPIKRVKKAPEDSSKIFFFVVILLCLFISWAIYRL